MHSKIPLILSVLYLTLMIGSCTPSPPAIISLSEANQNFIKLCQEEYGLKVITKSINNTLWIYLPTEQSLLDFAISKKSPPALNKATEHIVIHHLDGRFEEGSFTFEYDIALTKQYPAAPIGYDVIYPEKFQEIQNHLLTALLRSYVDLKKDSGEPPPEFIVLVIADIKKGIEESLIFNFEDFKRIQTGALPPEEFNVRSIPDLRGQESIIGDYQGKHLDYKEISWPDFLTKGIVNQVRFKYERSDFPPGEDTENELLKIISAVTRTYQFTNFKSIKLVDLHNGKDFLFDRSQLNTFAQ